jgi:hypothetical protein
MENKDNKATHTNEVDDDHWYISEEDRKGQFTAKIPINEVGRTDPENDKQSKIEMENKRREWELQMCRDWYGRDTWEPTPEQKLQIEEDKRNEMKRWQEGRRGEAVFRHVHKYRRIDTEETKPEDKDDKGENK